jgi:hypothetical protein
MDGGATIVEFALVFPLLLLLLFGVVEFGRFIAVSAAVETASREAARFGSAVGGTTPKYLDCVGIRAAGQRLTVVTEIDASEIDIEYDAGPGTGLLGPNCQLGPAPSAAAISSGDRIVVTVTDTFESVVPIIGNFIGAVEITSTDARTIFKGSL